MKRIIAMIGALLFLAVSVPTVSYAADMTASEDIIAFIKKKEGFSPKVIYYYGRPYIAYGNLIDPKDYPNGISLEDADKLMRKDVRIVEGELNSFLKKNGVTLNQHQFDCLVSFTYSSGPAWLNSQSRFKTILLNGPQNYSPKETIDAIAVWCHYSGKINTGLLERRLQEARLFVYGDFTFNNSPEWNYVIYDSGEGEAEIADILFYETSLPYGELQRAAREGYFLSGWQTSSGRVLDPNDIVSENLRVSAVWSKNGSVSGTQTLTFSDVLQNAWYFKFVTELTGAGIIKGYGDNTFRPQNDVSYGECLSLILKAAGHPIQQPLEGGHWASGYLALAVSLGIFEQNDLPDLDAPAPRIEIARISAKALGIPQSSAATPFSDVDDGYVTALNQHNIFVGNEGRFQPDDGITRAEISTIIWKITFSDVNLGKTLYYDRWVDVYPAAGVNGYDISAFSTSDAFASYSDERFETLCGVDVSSYQGEIDWASVKAAGIDFAVIRLGYRGYSVGDIYEDPMFEANVTGALSAGLNVGVYFFSQALTPEEAQEEASFVVQRLENIELSLPVFFDWEPINEASSRTAGAEKDTVTSCAEVFCSVIDEAGFTSALYFNKHIAYNLYDMSRFSNKVFWYADYSEKPEFYYRFEIWQYTDKGEIPGIPHPVDLDLLIVRK